jgi:hypothetical protein
MRYRTKDRITAIFWLAAVSLTIVIGGAWSLMIAAGIAHRDWWHVIPTMGFATAAALTFWPWFFTMLVAGILIKLRVFGS